MTLGSGKATPNAEGLAGGERIFEALGDDGALVAELSRHRDCLASDFWLWDVFREVDFWQLFTGDFAHTVDGHHKFAVWMSLVEHRVKCRR